MLRGHAVTLAEQLYRALRVFPCTCANTSHYEHGVQIVDQKCRRCAAVERYEAENPDTTGEPK